jgi:hypothetical protein
VLGVSSEIELRRGRLAAARATAAESAQLAADTGAGTEHAFALGRLGAAAAAMGLDEECRTNVAHVLAASEEAHMWSVPVYGHAALGLGCARAVAPDYISCLLSGEYVAKLRIMEHIRQPMYASGM